MLLATELALNNFFLFYRCEAVVCSASNVILKNLLGYVADYSQCKVQTLDGIIFLST